jgi:hypothetical protein
MTDIRTTFLNGKLVKIVVTTDADDSLMVTCERHEDDSVSVKIQGEATLSLTKGLGVSALLQQMVEQNQ